MSVRRAHPKAQTSQDRLRVSVAPRPLYKVTHHRARAKTENPELHLLRKVCFKRGWSPRAHSAQHRLLLVCSHDQTGAPWTPRRPHRRPPRRTPSRRRRFLHKPVAITSEGGFAADTRAAARVVLHLRRATSTRERAKLQTAVACCYVIYFQFVSFPFVPIGLFVELFLCPFVTFS